jgi:neutral ceramidase
MTLRAGTAVAEISPALPTALFGYPHVERIATGIHDPLLATALYLENSWSAVVLLALDVLLLNPATARSMRRAVAERTSVPEESVFISCSHTHSGPVTGRLLSWSGDPAVPSPDAPYLERLSATVAETAGRAMARTTAAEIAWTAADARGVGGNRHAADGVTDPAAGVLAVRRSGGGPLMAAALIYGMHPTVLHEDSSLVSADFPHYARAHLRRQFGEGLAVLYHTGPSGNQSPRFFVRGQTFDEAERLGRTLAERVAAALGQLPASGFCGDCELRGAIRPVDLAPREFPPVAQAEQTLAGYRAEYQRLKAAATAPADVRTAECAVFGAEGTLTLARLHEQGVLARTLSEYRPGEVQVLRIGPGCLVGLPGEQFAEYGLEIKRRLPGNVYVVSLVNGDLQGYLVTPEAEALGCYESLTSLFRAEAGRTLVEAAVEAVESLARS